MALHEASHIKYSDFELFKTLWMKIPRNIYDITEPLNIKKDDVALFCKDLLNYVEDRFIDYTVHANAPGYRGYYEALYDKYFNAKVITEALESDLYKVPSAESYMFRIINFTNPNTDLKALPGLVEIARKLDLSNIKRLTTPQDRLNVALDIAEIVFKNINEYNYESNVASAGGAAGDGSDNGSDTNKDDTNNVGSSMVSIDDLLGGQLSEVIQENNPVVDNIGQDSNISKAKMERIKKAFAKQKDFLKGTIKKKKVSRRDKNVLDTS